MEASSSSSSSNRATLLELPYDVFVDCLVPFIPTRDLARLRSACKTLQQWVDDEFIWRKRIADDFNFPEHASARVTGWQQLYRGLSSPKLFTWGESGSFRLGVDSFAMDRRLHDLVYGHYTGGAPFPLTVDYSRPKRMSEGVIRKDVNAHNNPANNFEGNAGTPVKIAAGGWGFHVLTTEGRLLAWGTMDGDVDSRARAWSPTPFVLPLPRTAEGGRDARVKQLSCGRKHGVALTSEGSVLEWHAWHDVRAHHEQLLPPEAVPPHSVASLSQLEAGWDFSVALFDVTTPTASSSLDGRHQVLEGNQALRSSASSRIVYWHTEWIGESDPEPAPFRRGVPSTTHWTDVPKVVLPPLPAPLSDVAEEMGMLSSEGQQQQDDGGLRIIQVGCGEDYVIALTSSGLVFKLDVSPVSQGAADVGDAASFARAASALTRLFEAGTRTWQLMEHFCVPSRIAALSAFAPQPGNERLTSLVKHREQLKIKHISAQFRTWAAYTSEPPASTRGEAEDTAQDSGHGGIVLMGKGDAVSSTGPFVKPELQGAGVIKISVGDWHYGALTSSGRVLTWGAWSNGALGIWDSLPLAQQLPQQPPPQTQAPLLGRFRIGLAGARLGIRQPLAQQQGPSGQQQGNAARDRLAPRIIPRQGVDVPTEVRSDEDEEKAKRTFVFDIAFAGWQSAAIAIDSRLVDGGQEEDDHAMEEDEQEEQDTLHQHSPSDRELSQVDHGAPSHDASSPPSSSSALFLHAPPSSASPRQRQPFNARQIASSASSIPSLGPIASSSITTPVPPPSPSSPAPTPTTNPSHERLPHLLTLTSLLFFLLGLSIVLFLPSSGLSLSPSSSSSSSSDSDEAGGVMVWLTRLSFWALLLIPMYLYATIARWVGESMGRG